MNMTLLRALAKNIEVVRNATDECALAVEALLQQYEPQSETDYLMLAHIPLTEVGVRALEESTGDLVPLTITILSADTFKYPNSGIPLKLLPKNWEYVDTSLLQVGRTYSFVALHADPRVKSYRPLFCELTADSEYDARQLSHSTARMKADELIDRTISAVKARITKEAQ